MVLVSFFGGCFCSYLCDGVLVLFVKSRKGLVKHGQLLCFVVLLDVVFTLGKKKSHGVWRVRNM